MTPQSSFPDLPKLSVYRYENFFNIYEDENKKRFYNLIRSINIFAANDSSAEDEYIVKPSDSWVYISYNYYNTIDLWWLVCEYNQIKNPTESPKVGTKLKLLKPEFVWPIISELMSQIKN